MHLSRFTGILALASVAGVIPAFSASGQLSKRIEPAPEVVSLKFNGVSKNIDKDELNASVYTDATKCRNFAVALFCKFTNYRAFEDRKYLNRQEFKRDALRVRLFYYRLGYREAEVDTVVRKTGERQVAIEFNIREGLPTIVADVRVDFDTAFISAKKARQLTIIQVNKPLNLFELDSTRVQFQNELWEQGYADALIDTSTVLDTSAHTARVSIFVVPNRLTTVGEIAIGGTEKVSPGTVVNSLNFRPGDLFRRSDVLESQRNLYESNLFKLAVLDIPLTFDSVKSVNVLLREAPLHESRTSFGFNSVDFIQAEGRFTDYNLFGGARRFQLSATVGNLLAPTLNGTGPFKQQTTDTTITGDAKDFLKPTYQASVVLQQSAFLQRPRNSVSIGAFAQRRAVPAVVIDNGYGGNATFTRSLGTRAPASLTYRFEVTRVEAGSPYFCVNIGVCDTVTFNALRSHQRLSPLTATAQVDRTDVPLNPSRGYSARVDLEHASSFTVSDYRYNRAYGEGTLFARLGGKSSVLASHLRIGFVRPLAGGGTTGGVAVLHPRKRFYAGGSQSVRGFGENQLGPRTLTVARALIKSGTTIGGAPCDLNSDAIRFCDPNSFIGLDGDTLSNDKFIPRAVGGTSLLEGSVEYRFPLPIIDNLGGAVFIDGAAIGERVLDPLGQGVSTFANLVRGTAAITPGFGIRYYSSVGPIRVDVGFNPSRAENLSVVTEITRNGKNEVIPLDNARSFSAQGTASGVLGLLNRFTLHLSIGQAY